MFRSAIRSGCSAAKKIGRFIVRNQIELIHAHVARDYLAAAVAARSGKDPRLVLTRHVMFPMKAFHRFALRNVDAAIAVSSAVSHQLARIFPWEKIHLIPNGIDLNAGAEIDKSEMAAEFRKLHSIPGDSPLIVTLGELKVLKGQRDFVLAAHEVVKQHPDVRFVVAGTDNSIDKKFRRELKRLVRVLGMEPNFLWLDWLDDIRPLLAAADIFVSPSHSESFGLAILDAMAAGCPVIATATDGAKELKIGSNAIVPIRDPLALANKICSFLDNAEARRDLGEQLQRTAQDKFSLAAMADATEELYDNLVKR